MELEFLDWANSVKVGSTTSLKSIGVCRGLLELLSVILFKLAVSNKLGSSLGFDSFSKNRTKACESDSWLVPVFEFMFCGCKMAFNQELWFCLATFSLSCLVKSSTVAIILRIWDWSFVRLLLADTKPITRFLINILSTFESVWVVSTLFFSSVFNSFSCRFVTERKSNRISFSRKLSTGCFNFNVNCGLKWCLNDPWTFRWLKKRIDTNFRRRYEKSKCKCYTGTDFRHINQYLM